VVDDALTEIDNRATRSPYILVALRILLSPAFLYAFMLNFTEIAVMLYLAAFISDAADGHLAKWVATTSSSAIEAYLDPVADFVLVLTSFCAFSLRQFYPSWILLAFALMFLFFIISSKRRGPLYDPVGKYYGTFLMTTIGITLFFPIEPVLSGVLLSIVAYTLTLVMYRTFFLWKNRKGNEVSRLMEELEVGQEAVRGRQDE
jgi:CDP-diacylglycerol--glycerol-3-phosphate 3-phosphatidyltransferase